MKIDISPNKNNCYTRKSINNNSISSTPCFAYNFLGQSKCDTVEILNKPEEIATNSSEQVKN